MSFLAPSLLAASLVIAFPGGALALQMTDVAGTVDGYPVTVQEADQAAGGAAAKAWHAMELVVRSAARGLCTERIHQMLAQSEGLEPQAWRARQWAATTPGTAEQSGPTRAGSSPNSALAGPLAAIAHESHVRAYRERLAAAADRILARELAYATNLAPGGEGGEPELPEVVASCLGRAITRDEVQSYAAYPLYERRADLVSKLCEQFEISYEKPLVVTRVAAAEGKTLEQLLAQIEGDLAEIPEEDVRRAASERYGRIDDETLFKARLALDAQRREDRRRAWIEKVRRESHAQCTLAMPETPESEVRAQGIGAGEPGALAVYYFANFECSDCRAGWQLLTSAAATYPGRVRVEFLHHFPEADASPFFQALEAECAARQGRFGAYGAWRSSPVRLGSAVDSVGLDAEQLDACMREPSTAVSVLDDTAEALRLGFREAVPSWVIGKRIKRGLQGQTALAREIDAQLAAPPSAPTPSQGAADAGAPQGGQSGNPTGQDGGAPDGNGAGEGTPMGSADTQVPAPSAPARGFPRPGGRR